MRSATRNDAICYNFPSRNDSLWAGKRFLLVHATPRDPLDEYLLKDSPDLGEATPECRSRRRVCRTHSHAVQHPDQWHRGPESGQCGLPRDGDPRAGFAIIEDNKIELRRVAYPVEETVSRVEAMPWPRRAKEIMSTTLRLGRLPVEMDGGLSAAAPDEPDPDDELESEPAVQERPD